MKRVLRGVASIGVVIAAACVSDQIAGPASADGLDGLEVRITIPDRTVGALVIAVSGGPVDSITPSGEGLEAIALALAPDNNRALLRGVMPGFATARIWVPDATRRSDYQVEVVEAADGTTYERRDTAGYEIQLREARGRARGR